MGFKAQIRIYQMDEVGKASGGGNKSIDRVARTSMQNGDDERWINLKHRLNAGGMGENTRIRYPQDVTSQGMRKAGSILWGWGGWREVGMGMGGG